MPVLQRIFSACRGSTEFVASENDTSYSSPVSDSKQKFADRLSETQLYESEEAILNNFDSLVDELRSWIKENGSPLNEALLDILLEEKSAPTIYKERLRRDGTLNETHEIVQTIRFIRDLEDGMKVDNPSRVISLILAHDLGEDFGLTPQLLKEDLLKRGIKEDQELNGFLVEFEATSSHFRSERGYKKGEKTPHPVYKDKAEYISGIHEHPSATVAKFYDNDHNVDTAIFGFYEPADAAKYIMTIEAMLPPERMKELAERHPSQADAYKQLKATLEQSYRAVYHWVAGDQGQNLNITPDNKVLGQTRLPAGLDTPEVGIHRMQMALNKTHDNPNLDV